MAARPAAFTQEQRIEWARERFSELYEDACQDPYRLQNCDDGMTIHLARMLRCRQREEGPGRPFRMSVQSLAGCLDSSQATIQRRLDFLMRHGHLRRISRGSQTLGSSRWLWTGDLN